MSQADPDQLGRWTPSLQPNAPATSTTRHCSRPPVAP
jgi:hypothetical protein